MNPGNLIIEPVIFLLCSASYYKSIKLNILSLTIWKTLYNPVHNYNDIDALVVYESVIKKVYESDQN